MRVYMPAGCLAFYFLLFMQAPKEPGTLYRTFSCKRSRICLVNNYLTCTDGSRRCRGIYTTSSVLLFYTVLICFRVAGYTSAHCAEKHTTQHIRRATPLKNEFEPGKRIEEVKKLRADV